MKLSLALCYSSSTYDYQSSIRQTFVALKFLEYIKPKLSQSIEWYYEKRLLDGTELDSE